MQPLLEIKGLETEIPTRGRMVLPTRGLDLTLPPRGSLGIAGESGCGKTMLLLAIMRLLPHGARITAGSILFEGQDLVKAPEAKMRAIRGRRIAMVFQEPMTALNPVFTIGSQLVESIRANGHIGRRDARGRAIELLQDVRIPDPTQRLDQYPHELSGGMRQRVVLAMALAARPALVLADEPTSSLDVTIQARVIRLLAELKDEFSLSLVFVSHDLALLSQLCDRIAVMYLGRVVEVGPTEEIVRNPLHPYTKALLDCIPPLPTGQPDRDAKVAFHEIPGELPDPAKTLPGCQFQPRCTQASPDCGSASPKMRAVRPLHSVACFKA